MSRPAASTAATLEKLIAREITIDQAVHKLGVGKRQVYRLLGRFQLHGQDGLVSRHKGRPGPRLFDEPTIFRIMDLICETYHDFGPTFASQKLLERDGIKVSRETLRQWMIGHGIWTDRAARQPRIHKMRDRRDRRGELVQIDGSPHAWLEDRGPKASLLVFIDDATGELMHLQFAPSETSLAYMMLRPRTSPSTAGRSPSTRISTASSGTPKPISRLATG